MSKVKLNLILSGKRCRSLEEVIENFNDFQLLEHLNSGFLKKWLKNRGYEDELKRLEELIGLDDYGKLFGIYEMFGVYTDKEAINKRYKIYLLEKALKKNSKKAIREALQNEESEVDKLLFKNDSGYDFTLKRIKCKKRCKIKNADIIKDIGKIAFFIEVREIGEYRKEYLGYNIICCKQDVDGTTLIVNLGDSIIKEDILDNIYDERNIIYDDFDLIDVSLDEIVLPKEVIERKIDEFFGIVNNQNKICENFRRE